MNRKRKQLVEAIDRILQFLSAQKDLRKCKGRITRQKVIDLIAYNLNALSEGKLENAAKRTIQGYVDGRTKTIPRNVVSAALKLEELLKAKEIDFFDPDGCRILRGLDEYFDRLVQELKGKNIFLMHDEIIRLALMELGCDREQLEGCLLKRGNLEDAEIELREKVDDLVHRISRIYRYELGFRYPLGAVFEIGSTEIAVVVESGNNRLNLITSRGENQTRINGEVKLTESMKILKKD